jgi:hypothetical protein
MSGVVGIDIQHTRAAIVLLEGVGADLVAQPIGDGTRLLIPAASGPPPLWGSSSAEAALQRLSAVQADLVDHLLDWRCDPLDTSFLRGIRDRLSAYLGQTDPTHRHGYHACFAIEGPSRDGQALQILRERCTAAGLTSNSTVSSTDALVCRWVTQPGSAAHSPAAIVAVSCGETWTDITSYRIHRRDPGIKITSETTRRVHFGSDAVCTELARMVLDRSHEAVRPKSLLPILDGVLEFGATLGTQSADQDAEWNGPLADRMFAPLRLSRSDMARWSQVRATVDAVAAEVDRAAAVEPLILIGGIGAIWPFIADALSSRGRVWQSQNPSEDIATGAAWWPRLRNHFTANHSEHHNGTPELPRPNPAPDEPPTETELGQIPPWER